MCNTDCCTCEQSAQPSDEVNQMVRCWSPSQLWQGGMSTSCSRVASRRVYVFQCQGTSLHVSRYKCGQHTPQGADVGHEHLFTLCAACMHGMPDVNDRDAEELVNAGARG